MNPEEEQKIITEFGKRLEKFREGKNLSLRDLAHIADVDHMSIHRIEKGSANPSLTMVIALARALEIDPAELLRP